MRIQSTQCGASVRRIRLSGMLTLWASLGLPLAAVATSAADSPRIVGAGAESCRSFLSHAGPSGLEDSAANQWIMGYLTGRIGANPYVAHRPFGGPTAIMAAVAKYCRDNQDFENLDLDAAAASFFDP